MPRQPYDVIVIGGGINGLVCAGLLGKRGLRTLLLEQRAEPGGCAAESELAPGFRVPTLAHSTGPLRRDVVEQLQLQTHGLRFLPECPTTSLSLDGQHLTIEADPVRTAEALRGRSPADADAWPAFQQTLARIGGVLGHLFMHTPPSVDTPSGTDLWHLLRTFGAFRGLPKKDAWRMLRWGPMAVADLVSECFETELLRATVAADGIFGAMLGPWSAGSGLNLLLRAANHATAWPGGAIVEGGPAAAARVIASAARRYGVEVRTGAEVVAVTVRHERARGVVLSGGEHIAARAVVSSLDPRRTFLSLCDADHLPPDFLWRMKRLRMRGTLAKVNLALSALPSFTGIDQRLLAGRVRIGPDLDYLERAFDCAKYGRYSTEPWIECTIPSLADASLAPAGAHVLSAYVQFAPYTLRAHATAPADADASATSWDDHRDALGDTAIRALARYAPALHSLIVAREVLTPLDLERGWGLTGGHIFHGELALDQFFTMRPLLGWAEYQTPIRGLYLCGSGTHPGTGLTGGSGANAAAAIARHIGN